LLLGLSWWHFAHSLECRERTSLANLKDERTVCIYGTVRDTTPSGTGKSQHLLVEVRDVISPRQRQMRGRTLLTLKPPQDFRAGDRLVVWGKVVEPVQPRHPWDFNEVEFLNRRDADTRFLAKEGTGALVRIPATPSPSHPDSIIAAYRRKIVQVHVEALGSRNGSLLTSIVIGNRTAPLDESVSEPFRNLGLSHLVAASGFNLSIVVAATWCMLKPFFRRRLWLNIAAGTMMCLYIAIAGVSPSIQRAALMCTAILFTGCFLRRTYLPGILTLTLAITLVLDPYALRDVGLQLSYVATAALIATSPIVFNLVNCFHNGAVRFFADVGAACVIAQFSVLPLLLYYFWQTGLLTFPANLMISPMIPLITVAGFTTSALACMEQTHVALLIDRVTGLLVIGMLAIVDWLNSFQWALLCTGPPMITTMIAYYISFGILITCKRFDLRAIAAAIALLISSLAIFYRPPLPPLTVACLHDGVVVIDSERNALAVTNRPDSTQLRRCLAYFATRATFSQSTACGSTARFDWETDANHITTVRLRTTYDTVTIGGKSKDSVISVLPVAAIARLSRYSYPVRYPYNRNSVVFSIDRGNAVRM
jgi:competence protein ComEC